jgi:microcystin-dependent protein
MAEKYLAQIVMFGCNFAPRNFADCDGQLLSIAQYSAVFSLLGTTYGGDGRTTFGLPDLRGRAALHHGNSTGPGLTVYSLGQKAGLANVQLNNTHMPAHTHAAVGNNNEGTVASPDGASWAMAGADRNINLYSSGTPNVNMASLLNTGGGQPHNNLMPFLGVRFCICLQGLFPSRN